MASLSALHNSIAAVCPIDGVSVGSWSDKTTWVISFDPAATSAQQSAAQTALQNFDPNGSMSTASATYQAALAAGLAVTWTTSTTLNDTYALDNNTQLRMLTERLCVSVNSAFTNGTTTLTWYGSTGTVRTMSMAQAGLFSKAAWKYLTQLWVAYNTALSGGTPSWPSSSVTITG